MLIAFEGIDGSGKGTQAARLTSRLQAAGISAKQTGFPRYTETFFGQAVGRYLNGDFGSLEQVAPFLAAVLYAGDRFESRALLAELQSTAEVVVLDRWMASNLAHQAARCQGAAREHLLAEIRRLECELYELPPADLTVLLDLPAERARELVARKSARDYTSETHDLQEADTGYQAEVRQVYRQLAAAEESRWLVVDCLRDGQLRSIDEISDEIFAAVRARLR